MPKTLVIVINYNSQHILDVVISCIKSLLNQIHNVSNTDLLLIDNGSSDNSFKEVLNLLKTRPYREIKKHIFLLRFVKNVGFAKACQIAFDNFGAHYDYIILVNNDLIPSEKSLCNLISTLERYSTIGAVQGIIIRLSNKGLDSAGVFLGPLLGLYPLDLSHVTNSRKNLIQISYADGAFLCVRSSALKKLGNFLFFEELYMYLEDLEMGIRLQRVGYPVYLIKTITGSHYRSASWIQLKEEIRDYLIARNLIVVLGLHFGFIGLLLAIVRIILVSFLFGKKSIYYSIKHGIRLRSLLLKRTKKLKMRYRPYMPFSAEINSLRKVLMQFLIRKNKVVLLKKDKSRE